MRAPTADAVLVGFCQQTTECHPFYPKELGVPANATPGTRVGLFGHPSADGTLAIYISRDRRDGSWIAGDGRSPIQLKDASRILLEGQPIVVGD